jgi:hypothetical protein
MGHIDIVYIRAHLDRGSVRSKNFRFVFAPLFSLNLDATRGTDARALPAADAIFYFVEKPRARPFRHYPFFRRVLQGDGFRKKVPPRNRHGF